MEGINAVEGMNGAEANNETQEQVVVHVTPTQMKYPGCFRPRIRLNEYQEFENVDPCTEDNVVETKHEEEQEVEEPAAKRQKPTSLAAVVPTDFTVPCYASYTGQVILPCTNRGNGNVALVCIIPGLPGQKPIHVKTVDAQANGLDPVNNTYNLGSLANVPPMVINVAQCAKNWATIQALRPKQNKTPQEWTTLQAALLYNDQVQAHYNSCVFVAFCHQKMNCNMAFPTNFLCSIVNVPNLDNAFFTGAYMVYGNGASLFFPMAAPDVSGHELGHGKVQSTANHGQGTLEYEGHAGALNESYADVIGQRFEKFFYDTHPHLVGQANWEIGEDVCKTMVSLRNMRDPTLCQQPKIYQGEYWADPYSSDEDNGGVHTNSGVGNYVYYLLSQALTEEIAFPMMLQVLANLPSNATYMQYRDQVKAAAGTNVAQIEACLVQAGLTDEAVSDWNP